MNVGPSRGAGVAGHLHMHALPRWPGDTNFMTTVGETRMLPEDLETTWKRMREAFAESGRLARFAALRACQRCQPSASADSAASAASASPGSSASAASSKFLGSDFVVRTPRPLSISTWRTRFPRPSLSFFIALE